MARGPLAAPDRGNGLMWTCERRVEVSPRRRTARSAERMGEKTRPRHRPRLAAPTLEEIARGVVDLQQAIVAEQDARFRAAHPQEAEVIDWLNGLGRKR